ncbi:hypothetical protein QJQ45_008179 [Haematococcus lacustris]|nr:hypothetical protein QJQ45_006660 [Haematococcus lacustris]KAJ9522348.1 hypothetical protein QJQ45_008179 [Haematococcus lacustris]
MKPDTTTPLEPMPMFQDTVKEVYDDEECYALLMWFYPDLLHDEVCFGKLTNTHCARYCQHMGLDRPKERRKLRRLVVRDLRSEQLEFEYEAQGRRPAAGQGGACGHRTTRVSSAVNGKQPCEEELNKLGATRPAGWKPPAGQVEQRLVRPAWSQQRDQPVRGLMWCPVVALRKPPQAPRSSLAATPAAVFEPGPSTPPPAKRSKRTKVEQAAEPAKPQAKARARLQKPNQHHSQAALNMQRIGESRWRPLVLCYWEDQGALPAKGKEYPGLGYKRLRDKPPKAPEQQQQQPAVAQ